ncbi:acyl-CoA dehydrogenase family protein [Streptomyces collinus]|uniref:acyl-CoA dehydrogenase family protein n=1 Tax=Streptomyces collinus TaxID=42684 RepID=UPI0036CA668A
MRTRARREGDAHALRGEKAWKTHGGHADLYQVMARTSDHRTSGVSCFLVPAEPPGLSADPPERKTELTGPATATVWFDEVRAPEGRRPGEEGHGLPIALAGLDTGRLGIAAVAVGLAQGALDERSRTRSSGIRQQSGSSVDDAMGVTCALRPWHGRTRAAFHETPPAVTTVPTAS